MSLSSVHLLLQVLTGQPDNSKALFRRGRAQLQLGNTEAAERDLSQAAALAPHDPAIRKVPERAAIGITCCLSNCPSGTGATAHLILASMLLSDTTPAQLVHCHVQELAAVRKARKEERDVQSSLFKGRLFPPGPPPADPQVDWAADVRKPLLVRLWAHLTAFLRLLFPAEIWPRDHVVARTEVSS
jgi:hypothetical protein